jgi:hypothetical protein
MNPACAPPLLKKAMHDSLGGFAGAAAEVEAASKHETASTNTQTRCRIPSLLPVVVDRPILVDAGFEALASRCCGGVL